MMMAVSMFLNYFQDNRALGFRAVWYSEPRCVAGWWAGWGGGGCEDVTGGNLRAGHCQVPAGGCYKWTVQTPQHCPASWSGHCWETGRCVLIRHCNSIS